MNGQDRCILDVGFLLHIGQRKKEYGSKSHTWKSLSVLIGKYMRPRSLLTHASTPIFSLTSSAAVCSNPVGTVAPMVTVMMSPVVASFSGEEEEVGGPTLVSGPCSAAPPSWEDMLYVCVCTGPRGITGYERCVSQLVASSVTPKEQERPRERERDSDCHVLHIFPYSAMHDILKNI